MTRARFQAVPLDGFHIILDLDEDRYIAVRRGPETDIGVIRDELAQHLSADQTEIDWWPGGYPRISPPTSDLGCRLPAATSGKPRIADWLALARSAPRALQELRRSAPREWLRTATAIEPADPDAAFDAARRFRSMRPMIPGLARCLPHALLLRAFLETLGLQATLVIGVRVFPFEAHSWVEAGGVVLTDDLERLAAFTAVVAG